MKPWQIVVAAVAAVALILFVGSGSDGRTFAARAGADVRDRSQQPLNGQQTVTSPEDALFNIMDQRQISDDATAKLTEARDQIVASLNQIPEQAKALLEQAIAKIDAAQHSVKTQIDNTSNLAVKMALERIYVALSAVKSELQVRVSRL